MSELVNMNDYAELGESPSNIGFRVISFDYAALPCKLADEARGAAARIRLKVHSSVVEIGRELIAMKNRMEHGTFNAWIIAALSMSVRSAENYMNGSRFVAGKNATVANLPPAVIYALAAPSAPRAVVDEVLAAADKGVLLDAHEIKTRLLAARKADRATRLEAKQSPEQVKTAQKARVSKQQRQARLDAARRQREEQAKREEIGRADRLRPLARRVATVVGPEDLVTLAKALGDWQDQSIFLRLLVEIQTGERS